MESSHTCLIRKTETFQTQSLLDSVRDCQTSEKAVFLVTRSQTASFSQTCAALIMAAGFMAMVAKADPTSASPQCGSSGTKYALNASFHGRSFANGWKFSTAPDPTHGPTLYVNQSVAEKEGLLEYGDGWATVRTGGTAQRLANGKNMTFRKSLRLESEQSWTHFLLVLNYEQVPAACGLWPAFWTTCAHEGCQTWPGGGEVDILEYVNRGNVGATKSSVHIGGGNICNLSHSAIAACNDSFTDKNNMGYDCTTDYSKFQLGCAPNTRWGPSPADLAKAGPGVMVMEWTEDFIRIFHLDEEPADLARDAPAPDTWPTSALVSYYPFKASAATCPDYKTMLSPQNVILNLATCGDYAGGYDWTHDLGCQVQGDKATGRLGATCAEYVVTEGASEHFRKNANMNISYVKVFTPVNTYNS